MIKPEDFKVRVSCLTYNHSSYIVEALNGFVMQQTDFPFVCIIVDDASTDGTQEVIRDYVNDCFVFRDNAVLYDKDTDYGHITYAQHKTNKNCFFVVIYLRENHYRKKPKSPYYKEWSNTKYIAICEGDDYWTDPRKLQRQVDYLEEHEGVGVCYTDYSRLEEATKKMIHSMFEEQGQYRPESYEQHLLKPGYLAPMTWVFKKDLMGYLDNRSGSSDVTYMMMLEWLYNSKVGYLPINTAVYRSHHGSASSPIGANKMFECYKSVFDAQLYYANKYPCSEALIEKIKVREYLDVLPVAVKAGNEVFINDAKSYLESKGYTIELIIRDLKEGQAVRNSYAYKVGKVIVSPFSRLRKNYKRR